MINKEAVVESLRRLPFKVDGMDAIDSGIISGVVVREDRVGLSIEADRISRDDADALKNIAERAVRQVDGVKSVTTVLTSTRAQKEQQAPQRRPAEWNHDAVPGIKKIIAVASGKGGVGKSTVAVNLAAALKNSGKNVGILDADIYGPSLPRMMNLSGKPETEGGRIIPLDNYGIKCMSMGFLVAEDQPIIWRGPMLTKTISQFLRMTEWGELDFLIVDMPPGTGDIHISMIQQVPLSGVIIVSTPQDVAWIDARRCLVMFRQLGVPIIGIVENMSYFIDPVSRNRTNIFGEGGSEKAAKEFGVPFLGEIPIDISLRENADKGIVSPNNDFVGIADRIS